MLIVNRDKAIIVNIDSCDEIRAVPRDECSTYVRADFKSGKGISIAEYETADDAYIAIDLLISKMLADKESTVISMPTQEEVTRKRQDSAYTKPQHLTGKKCHGHGGS